jgi:8-oxo-dGTP pyrophosphatase MutT (NUDIX family)
VSGFFPVKARAAVIIIENDKIALIKRYRLSRHYFVFPGGKIKTDETPVEAAAREAEEELGLKVIIGSMVAEVWYQGTPQYYFLAESVDGQFGQGSGAEMNSPPDSEKGSYLPVWVNIDTLLDHPLLPKPMAEFIWESYHEGWPDTPLLATDSFPEETTEY